jgi:hypothetical protein
MGNDTSTVDTYCSDSSGRDTVKASTNEINAATSNAERYVSGYRTMTEDEKHDAVHDWVKHEVKKRDK